MAPFRVRDVNRVCETLVNTGGVAGQGLMYRLLADLRARVAQAEAQMQTAQSLSLAECTVSIGLVPFSSTFDTPQSWLQHADRALYRAKREGRDGMVVLDAEGVVKSAREGETGADAETAGAGLI
ncbi:diguanylate cyclase [Pandoraea fibrosis]|uniref:diguanylate cyclase n=1 Tax=Pandoraea fibrosis TaxID=1891094 RepID=A0ABX6HKZ2_9BURK|nr:GGDEF domain-containing protein [Pandoraea fibrosis]QHE90705.1 diguanylate cyclase [Pandoraea fibrosis]QHF11536.1 diguanylate cyclase [Pandoraea fibrosis]